MASETASILARQPSGIRAVPSIDDDDDDDDYYDNNFDANLVNENDNSVDEYSRFNDSDKNLSMTNNNSSSINTNKSSESSSISSSNTSNTTRSSENTGSLVNGGEEHGNAEGDSGKPKMVGNARNEASGSGSSRVPVAKVSGEGDDDDDDDDDEIEVGIDEEDGAQVEESHGVQKVVPRVRVLDEVEEEGEEEWDGAVEGAEVETAYEGEARGVESSKIGENANLVGSASEGKYAKDSTYADVVVAGSAAMKEPEVEEGNEETLAVENASEDSGAANGGVKLTDEGDAVVDSVKVDAAEAVRSGTAVVEGSKVETAKDEEGVGEEEAVESLDVGSVAGNEETLAVENASEDSGAANGGVKFTDEGDAVVDSVKVDAAEAVRSGTAVVEGSKVETPKDEEGVGEEGEVESLDVGSVAGKDEENSDILTSASKGSSVKNSTYAEAVVSGSAAAKDKEDTKESVVGGGNEENHAVEFASGDSAADVGNKYTGEGDAVVDSINVDAAEAVRSGNAVVGDFEGTKDLGAELESSVAENAGQVVENSDANGSAPEVGEFEGTKDSGAELESSVAENAGQVLENSVANGSAPEESKLIKTDGVKSTDEKDSVVDSINVDVVQAARSGVAAVGDSEVNATEPEVKEDSARVAENVTSANEFAALATANSSEIVDVDDEQPKVSQLNEAEAPQPVESVEEQDIEKTKPEADLLSKQQEPTNEQHSNHGGESEKVQPLDVETKERSVELDGLDAAASDIPSPANGVNAEEENLGAQEKVDDEGTGTDEDGELVYFGGGNSSNKIIEELESGDRSEMMDGQVVTESEDGESDEEGEGKELFDSSAFAALLKAATSSGSDPGTITISSQDGSRLFSVQRPAGLGPSLRSVRPASGPRDSNFISPSSAAVPSEENLSEEEKNKLQNLQQLKVKFLRLVQRVGYTAEHSVAAQVLYKLSFFGGRPAIPAFSLDNAKQTAMQLEAEGKDDLNFSLTILVLGKTGVGKSAVINSILLEEKAKINAFEPETTSVNEIYGTVDGVKIRFIDVPGLKSAAIEQGYNRKVLESVKKITKKNPVDVVFYVDRLDSQTRDLNDLPMLRTITSSLGSSIWRNTIITLTHASCAPPDGPSGTPLSYEVFVAQRSHIAQQSIGQAVGDLRLMNLNMMSPVSLVENHHACRKNREGQKVLPNGQAWRPQLLVLCYSVKILSEASSSAKPQDPFDSRKLFGFRVRSPPLPYLLSSMLQPRAHPKLSADQGGDNVDSDIDLDDLSDSDEEDELDEYDQLPPFKPLRKSQLAKLSNEQKKAYFEEYDYRVKLLQKKQWKEELKRMKEMKKGKSGVGAYGEMPEDDGENADGENGTPAPVPVPLPDMALPPTFDSDNPAYRYRFLEPTSQFLARPVLDTHGWDHDCGYDGVNVEQNLGIAGRFPLAVTAQVTKDKKDFNVHLDSAVAAKHGENGSSLLGFDVQSIGKQYAYIVKGESKFKNLKKNKTTAGVSVTFLGENVAPGVKVEDQITLGKRLVLVGSTGTVRSRKEAAYGANLEVRLREADYPVGQEQSTFTLSLMKWRGDLAIGGNLQSQISVGRNSKMALRVALNNKQSGQITVKTSSSDHLSLAIAGLVPIALSIYQKFKPGVSPSYSIY